MTGSSGTDENHVLQRVMLEQRTLKAIVGYRGWIILSDAANRLNNCWSFKIESDNY